MHFACFSFVSLAVLIPRIETLRKQGVAVRGQLMCGSVPANGTKVRIVDIDTGQSIG